MIGMPKTYVCRFSSLLEHFFPVKIDILNFFLSGEVKQTAKNCTFFWFLLGKMIRSTRPQLVLVLTTRCLYWGEHQPSWPDVVPLLATRCLYFGGMSEVRLTGPQLVPFLATRCLYWGVDLPRLGLPNMSSHSRAGICEIVIWGGRSAKTWSASYELSEQESVKLPFHWGGVDLLRPGLPHMSCQSRNLWNCHLMGG